MKLVDIYSTEESAPVLFRLLAEREPQENISHKKMPSYAEHCAYIDKRPCAHWYLIEHDHIRIGSIYLTRRSEIGVQLFRVWCGKGFGRLAVEELMRLHPAKWLANINPGNERSIKFFQKLGFKLLQVTFSKEA